MTGLQMLRAMMEQTEPSPGIGTLLGMQVLRLEDGVAEMGLTTRPDFANPLGTVHGGIAATLLDSVLGCAVHSTLPAATGYTTLDLAVKYLRTVPTSGVRLRGVGRVVHRGSRVITAEGSVLDEQDRLVATGTATCLVLPAAPRPTA